ncbi:septum site-determining protein MinC [Mesorhizobium sp. INR15]|uniref:septum site-determining protein MinC n=1 Tax=Mesorhizobium sp. INR15 TaxID=2654248 RepID=UPI001896A253|nr:septum site-determining protein MinC [Mesorhizobium sp. INR15]QPC91971.1 septum formation inhibitor MinC [Mesorhizobium sp. INR15]
MTFAAPIEKKSIRFRARSFVAFTLTPEAPLDAWLEGLDLWIGNSPGFFTGRPVVLDLHTLKPQVDEIGALVGQLGERGIRIYAIEGHGNAALGADLPPVLTGGKEASTEGLFPQPERAANAGSPAKADEVKTGEYKPLEAETPNTLMIKSPIRSGQLIFHPHGDVIVLGSVASGSEIMAGGSIHVYGTLRGRAFAGAQGNAGARIFCRKNEAELLAVDGWYCTAEEMDPSSRGRAIQAFLQDGVLSVAPLN